MSKAAMLTDQACKLTEMKKDLDKEINTNPKIKDFIQAMQDYHRSLNSTAITETQKAVTDYGELVKDYAKLADQCKEYEFTCKKLSEALKNERKEHGQFYDNVAFSMLIAPKETFEAILRQVERKKKIESCDGYRNWQWTLEFSLLARIKMAFKLIFSSGDFKRELLEESTINQ